MNIALFAYTRQGCRTARRLMAGFPADRWEAYTMEKFGEPDFLPLGRPGKAFYAERFSQADALVFVGACGIAVREIAPHVRDKRTDPAVVCVDELGKFVIPLLSGHIGGANELARKMAACLAATAVITTATDIGGRFSVDSWAVKNGFAIDSMALAKAVSAGILEGSIPLSSDFPVVTDYPSGLVPGDSGELGILLSWQKRAPFSKTLRLIPKVLHLGIGCRKGTGAEVIRRVVMGVLEENRIDPRAVKCACSIDLKREEAGLLRFCGENQWPVSFYSAGELLAVPGEFTASPFVKSVTGVDNVCERAALLGAQRLIVKKHAENGVTAAVAAEKLEVRFE